MQCWDLAQYHVNCLGVLIHQEFLERQVVRCVFMLIRIKR
jgi:hypothetical protein